MPLLSASQMAALQSTAELGLQTDVTIYHRDEADNPYSDDEGVWATPVSTIVKGWMRSVPAGVIDVVSGVQAEVSVFRLLLPVGTVVNGNDRVTISGKRYIVEDVASENTYQMFTVCSVRRAE